MDILSPQRFENIENKDGFEITYTFAGATPATATNYEVIYVANRPVEVMKVKAVWRVASTSGTLNIEKLTGTQALNAGLEILKTNISTSAAANTVVSRSGYELQNRELREGDRIALKDGGTLTNLAGLTVTIYLHPLGKGDYR